MTEIDPNWNKDPVGYKYREFRREDGAMEGVVIEHAIVGGTMERESDGQPVAYAGINQIADKHWVFFYVKDDNLRRTMWLMRLMKDSLRMIKNAGITELYALCDLRFRQAPQFLRALGFERMPEMGKSIDVLLYENLMSTNPELPTKAWRLDMTKESWLWR